jgi:hypothetical protein
MGSHETATSCSNWKNLIVLGPDSSRRIAVLETEVVCRVSAFFNKRIGIPSTRETFNVGIRTRFIVIQVVTSIVSHTYSSIKMERVRLVHTRMKRVMNHCGRDCKRSHLCCRCRVALCTHTNVNRTVFNCPLRFVIFNYPPIPLAG